MEFTEKQLLYHPIPMVSDSVSYSNALKGNCPHVKFLESKVPGMFDHSLMGDTYKKEFDKILKNIGGKNV